MAAGKRKEGEDFSKYRERLRVEERATKRQLKGRHTGIWGSRYNKELRRSQFLIDNDLAGAYVQDLADARVAAQAALFNAVI